MLPDGALILPVIPDRIILVKDNKTKVGIGDVKNLYEYWGELYFVSYPEINW